MDERGSKSDDSPMELTRSRVSDEHGPDVESILDDEPAGKKIELRLWLKMLSCANLVTADIRRNLRTDFDVTLPRFDLMAQLYREPEGLRLGELSRRMMVTNGNITGLVDHLASEGLILRETTPGDRRVSVVRLSPAGREIFGQMAERHESWIHRLFGDIDRASILRLIDELDKVKRSVRANGSFAGD